MMKRGGGKLNNRRYSVNRMTGAVPQKKMGVGMLEQVVTHQCASEACRLMVKGSFKQRSAEKKSNDATQNAAKSIVLQKTATEIRELAAKHNLLF